MGRERCARSWTSCGQISDLTYRRTRCSSFSAVWKSRTSSRFNNVDLKNIESIYPLAPLQENLLLSGIAAETHRGQFTVSLTGDLDAGMFAQAWREVALRRAAFRTFFAWKRVERPLQLVSRDTDFSVAQLDLRVHPP